MKRSAGHAVLMAKHPWLRKFYYGFFGGASLFIGVMIAHVGYADYVKDHRQGWLLIALGIAFPFIIIGGEIYRYRDGAKKVRGVRCRDCGGEFPLKAIYKTGRCPECKTKRLVGVRLDGTDM